MTTNEAAERLLRPTLDFIEQRSTYNGQIVISLGAWRDTVRPAIEWVATEERAAERRATVERIKIRLIREAYRSAPIRGDDPTAILTGYEVGLADAILDEEAAR